MTVRTRMAPSPTGDMHVGSMAILLKNYAWAKKNKGTFVLRIEDTDKEREVEGGVQRIQEVIKAYGLEWDEGPSKGGEFGPYIQSERLDIYQKYAEELVTKGEAYYCFCSKERLEQVREEQRAAKQPPHYDRHCRTLTTGEVKQKLAAGLPSVIRLKVPDNQEITFNDVIRGDITFNSSEIDDQVLLKSDGYPTYHLAVVVDDHLMQITHIMRGEEWISSTPKHILLYQAFGWEKPVFAHIPVFLNPDGKGKMSKRKGTVSAQSFLDKGYLPEALLNFFMILGWTPKDEREMLTLDEYIQEFDPADVSPKSVVFDVQKLNWINGLYIRQLPFIALKERLQAYIPNDFPIHKLDQILPLVMERLVTLSEFDELTNFWFRDIQPEAELLLKKGTKELVASQLQQVQVALSNVKAWEVSEIEKALRGIQEQEEYKKNQYFMMLRVATTGKTATPPLFETIEVLGQEVTLQRLQEALIIIGAEK